MTIAREVARKIVDKTGTCRSYTEQLSAYIQQAIDSALSDKDVEIERLRWALGELVGVIERGWIPPDYASDDFVWDQACEAYRTCTAYKEAIAALGKER